MKRFWLPTVAILGVLAIGGLPAAAIVLADQETNGSSAEERRTVSAHEPDRDRQGDGAAPRVRTPGQSTPGGGQGYGYGLGNGMHHQMPPGAIGPSHRPFNGVAGADGKCFKAFQKMWTKMRKERGQGQDLRAVPPRLSEKQRARLQDACGGLVERFDGPMPDRR